MTATGGRGMVLRWLRELVERLSEVGPPNQTRIVAVAAVMVGYANADGTRMEASVRTLARETGQHSGRVSEAFEWLVDDGWLRLEGRIAHGGRRFTLTIPQRSGESNAGSAESSAQSSAQSSGQRSAESSAQSSGQRSGDKHEPPTSDSPTLRTPTLREREEAALSPRESALWGAAVDLWGEPLTKPERASFESYLSELAEARVTPKLLPLLVEKARWRWGFDIEPTMKSIVSNLGALIFGPRSDKDPVDYEFEEQWEAALAEFRGGLAEEES